MGKEIPTPIDKGYPNCFSEMSYWVLFEEDEPVAYTASGYGSFTLVGNTYVKSKFRKQGSHGKLYRKGIEASWGFGYSVESN